MPRFTGIPSLPQSGVDEWNLRTLNAIKQNVELLTGSRGEQDLASKALLRSQFSVTSPAAQTMTQATPFSVTVDPADLATVASGAGTVIVVKADTASWTSVVNSAINAASISDLQRLANDVATLRATVDALVQQIRA